MALSVWAVAARVPSEGSPKEHLALEVVVGAAVYLGLLHLFRVAAYRDVLKVLSSPAWTPIRVRTSERAAADGLGCWHLVLRDAPVRPGVMPAAARPTPGYPLLDERRHLADAPFPGVPTG